MALVRHSESLQIKLIRNLLEFGEGYLTVDEDDTYHPFSGCKTLDKSIENGMVKYYRKDGNIIFFLKELFSRATTITQDFNFYQSIQYTYVQKVLEPVWIINFLKTLSFFDGKSFNMLEFFAFLASDLYKETKVFDFLGISINNPGIAWENTSNYYMKLSQFLDNIKDYVYKKNYVPDVIDEEIFYGLYNPKASYYKTAATNINSSDRKIFNDFSQDEINKIVAEENDAFNIGDFFLNDSDGKYTTAAVIMIAPDGRTLKADCKLSLKFRYLPYDYPIDHGNTMIILYRVLYGKWIRYDGDGYYIEGDEETHYNKLLDIISNSGIVAFMLCNYHEEGERPSAIWLPENVTQAQQDEIKKINGSIKTLCTNNAKFFSTNPLVFSYISCIDDNVEEPSETNGFDGIFDYIQKVCSHKL